MDTHTLRASVAHRSITPQIGTPLFGYGNADVRHLETIKGLNIRTGGVRSGKFVGV
jgi:hypothetical protein